MTTPHEDDHLTLQEAADVLEVPVEQVQAMVEEGLLDPSGVESSSTAQTFLRADVEAARLVGG
jgi:hypothetical protein